MNRFITNTEFQEKEMLDFLNIKSHDDLYADIPENYRIKEPFALPEALSEYDLKKVMQNLAGRNISASDAVCFLGAGVYDHFVPSIVSKITNNAGMRFNGTGDITENQNALSVIYECQSYIKSLCGMENVSLAYKGVGDALYEVLLAAKNKEKKTKVVVLHSVNPEYKKVLQFACNAYGLELCEADCSNGTTSEDELFAKLDEDTSLVIAQNPNYFGIIEDMKQYSDIVHAKGAMFAAIVDPISLALLSTPQEYNADFAIGNCQSLGGALSFGSSHFAFFASDKKEYCNGMVNVKNEKFEINGCKKMTLSNFIAILSTAVYLAYMGDGIENVARTCYSNAYYTYEKLTASSAFKPVFNKPFFREFAVKATKKNVNDINNRMLDYGMIGGVALKNEYSEYGNSWLVAVTEKRSADEVELFVKEASRSI